MNEQLFGERLALVRCPHCSVHSPNLVVRERTNTQDSEGKRQRYWKFYACATCGGIVVASADKNEVSAPITAIFPRPKDDSDETVPMRVKHFLAEAIECVHAPYASIMASAAAVEAMLAEKEYGGDLPMFDRIDQAISDGLISPDMGKWAHRLPFDSMHQRYNDEGPSLPVQDDAQQCLEFAQTLALVLFTVPSRVEQGKLQALRRRAELV